MINEERIDDIKKEMHRLEALIELSGAQLILYDQSFIKLAEELWSLECEKDL
ncbi:MAG: hypothetical protein ACE3L7_14665 [Candidatus Pristimantibacillus sp.]